MKFDCIETIKIKVRVGDAIPFIKKMKENLPEVAATDLDAATVVTDTNFRSEFVGEDNQLALGLQFRPDNSAVRIRAKENDIGVAGIYPCADVKNKVRAGFIHDKNVGCEPCQLCASRPVRV